MTVFAIPSLKDNYIYAIGLSHNKIAIVDPGEEAPVLNYCAANSLQVDSILVTHHHWDHASGVVPLKKHFNCEVIGPQEPLKPMRFLDEVVADQSAFKLDQYSVRTIQVPGHTLGQVCYYFEEENALFVGDTLFGSGCGRVFEGTYEQMFLSLQKIKSLPGHTNIFCGHEYTIANINFLEDLVQNKSSNALTKEKVIEYKKKVLRQIESTGSSVPLILENELQYNPFLFASSLDEFSKYRDLRNNF